MGKGNGSVRTERIHSGAETLAVTAEAAEVAVGALNRAAAVGAGHPPAHVLVEALLLLRPLEEARTACAPQQNAVEWTGQEITLHCNQWFQLNLNTASTRPIPSDQHTVACEHAVVATAAPVAAHCALHARHHTICEKCLLTVSVFTIR